jgi:hypothetical protein
MTQKQASHFNKRLIVYLSISLSLRSPPTDKSIKDEFFIPFHDFERVALFFRLFDVEFILRDRVEKIRPQFSFLNLLSYLLLIF